MEEFISTAPLLLKHVCQPSQYFLIHVPEKINGEDKGDSTQSVCVSLNITMFNFILALFLSLCMRKRGFNIFDMRVFSMMNQHTEDSVHFLLVRGYNCFSN